MIIVTLSTGAYALKDIKCLLWSIEQVYKNDLPDVFIYTDTDTSKLIPKYNGNLTMKIALDFYGGMNRQEMERMPGRIFKTKWTDFMCEKISALRYAFDQTETKTGCWFLDADIMLFDKLPTVPETAEVALAPHYIRVQDEAKYGRYNGGFLWIKDQKYLDIWLEATLTSRFYEQAALEEVAKAAGEKLFEIPIQHNFGWWRLWQSSTSSEMIAKRFGFGRNQSGIGILFDGKPLASIHTHWYEQNDQATKKFNDFILNFLKKIPNHKPASEYNNFLRKAN